MVSLLFFTRLLLYLVTVGMPIVHPGVVVSYDQYGWWLWFGLVPLEMLIAFYLAPPRLKLLSWLSVAIAPIALLVLFVAGLSPQALLYLGFGLGVFLLTFLVFRGGPTGRRIAIVEPFVLATVLYRLVSFSRSSEETAFQSAGTTQVILIITMAAFLLHGLVLYLAAFRGQMGRRLEWALLGGILLPAVVLLVLLLPPDFIKHSIVLNRLGPEPEPESLDLPFDTDGRPGGNLRSRRPDDGRRPGQGQSGDEGSESEDGEAGLEGIPADQWGDQQSQRQGEGQGEGGDNRQYAVMIVASDHDPIYAAEGYFGRLDGQRGFQIWEDEGLNELSYLRLLETWEDQSLNLDVDREAVSQFYLSTIPERVLAYKPDTIAPTILDRRTHPFNYSYTVVSGINDSSRAGLLETPELNDAEIEALEPYLALPLSADDKNIFLGYLDDVLEMDMSYHQRIDAIINSFAGHQYEIGFTDDVSVARSQTFLTVDKTGDCTEFSNTAAILARVAGIPSRVVTGYLASSSLQTPAHYRGLIMLKESISALDEYGLGELFLVTNAHRHSWLQLYLPGKGWVDYDPTTVALPPPAGGDANSMDVVIPLLQEGRFDPAAPFPWRILFRILGLVALLAVVGVYMYRYGSEAYLGILSRRRDHRGLRATYRLLLMRLASEGYEVKIPSETPLEYSDRYEILRGFAAAYTRLYYRDRSHADETLWRELGDAYRQTLSQARRRGPAGVLKRSFSLRPLYYQW